MVTIIEDEELGRLIVRVDSRARNLIFRTKDDGIYVTTPPGVVLKEVQKAIESLRSKLLKDREKQKSPLIDANYVIDADYFKLSFVEGADERLYADSRLESAEVVYPADTNFADEDLQGWLRKMIGECLRRSAKGILPPRLSQLSKQFNLPYAGVKINSSQGRWGSCSARTNINLSYYLLLLPAHLIDYVLLHELCHTHELNHSDRFWALLNQCTDGKALALREELKNYRTVF